MDLEELTKTQIVLLVLLVSFVTSIATGIVTVSLLAQAPSAVTQTVNQIIERTVQTVVPDTGTQIITKETTVVVKEDDLVTKSVADSLSRIGRIHANAATSSPVIAVGSITGSGLLVTDSSAVSGTHAVTFDGDMFLYEVSNTMSEIGIAYLTATGTAPTRSAFKIADAGSLRLGQTVIGLFGEKEDRIGMTTVSGLAALATVKVGESSISVRAVATTLGAPMPGTPLITIFGDLVGISTSVSRASDRDSFVAMSDIAGSFTGKVRGEATSTPAE